MQQNQRDVNLGYAEVQALGDADALAAFFERLGYNTRVRRIQAPANLGITAESTLKAIKRVDLLADSRDCSRYIYSKCVRSPSR